MTSNINKVLVELKFLNQLAQCKRVYLILGFGEVHEHVVKIFENNADLRLFDKASPSHAGQLALYSRRKLCLGVKFLRLPRFRVEHGQV